MIPAIEIAEQSAAVIDKSLQREGNQYKELLQYIRSIPGDIIKKTVYIGPNFIKFLFSALKSKNNDAKTKLLFTGIIVSLSTLLGFMVWDISLITMLFAIGALTGPATLIGGVMFGSLILLIKSTLTAFIVLAAMKLSNMMYEDTEIEKIATEAFGQENGKSFVESFNELTNWDDGKIDQYLMLAKQYFDKLGKKFENKDLSTIEEKIAHKIKKKPTSTKKTNPNNRLLQQLKALKKENPLDDEAIILVITLLHHAISVDNEVTQNEIDILIDFIKDEYYLDDYDVDQFLKQIDKEKDFKSLLDELKKSIPKKQLKNIINTMEKIILADDKITEEEQLLLNITKKQLLE